MRGDRVIDRFRTQKNASLLAYLAFHLHLSHPREALIELLWPECDPAVGRDRLSTALTSLRRQLEPPELDPPELEPPELEPPELEPPELEPPELEPPELEPPELEPPELEPPVFITGRPSPVCARGSRRGSYGLSA